MQVTNNILNLPNEILVKILSNCPIEAIFSALITCKTFSEIPSKFFWNQYLISAQNGKLDSVSTFHLGNLFFKANGAQDITGWNLIEIAASKNHPLALFSAAMINKSIRKQQPELNVSKTLIKSLLYQAAEQEHPEAQYRYGKSLVAKQQAKLGLPYLERAAANGWVSAQREMGLIFRKSKKDYKRKKAETLLKEAAKSGDAKAFFALAKRQGLKDGHFPYQTYDIEAVKFYLGVHFAKKFSKAAKTNSMQNIDEVKAYLNEEQPYFSQFPEVCFGMMVQLKKNNKSFNREEKKAYKMLCNIPGDEEKMAFRLGVAYAAGILIPRNDERILDCFNAIRKNKFYDKVPNYGKPLIDIMECFRFMNELKELLPAEDALHEKLKSRLKAQATMHNDASLDGASLANSILLSESCSVEELLKADLNWLKSLMAKCDLDSNEELCLNIFYWLKHSKNLWQSKEEYSQIVQQIRLLRGNKPMSVLEKLLLGYEV